MRSTEEIRQEILEAALEARSRGIEIKQGDWAGKGHCCPLTAWVVKKRLGPGEYTDDALEATADEMLPEDWFAGDFASGFDGEKTHWTNESWEAGRWVGRQLGFSYDDSWMEPDDADD